MNHNNAFETWFAATTGHRVPRDWQIELGRDDVCRSRLIRIPTGLGKTEGVLTAWMWHSIAQPHIDVHKPWPRRLVWCLPMRVLVEQTKDAAQRLVDASGLDIGVHMLLGGIEPSDWHLYPERPAIIVGTQDMLLSRALNRGYATGRARWPHEFGLLNHDCLWVMDEIQLMDVGLATSAQLQAYRDRSRQHGLRPCHTWWMSATLQPQWLRSVDTEASLDEWSRNPCRVPTDGRSGGVWDIKKTVSTLAIPAKDAKEFAQLVVERHREQRAGAYGKITLAICNTVERAVATYEAIRTQEHTGELQLVHSRFRPHEREAWNEFLRREACQPEVDRIIVATQVVEAGVDISAGCLITELAPWPSLVQRFGRCARYGGSGQVVVVDRGQDEKSALPYSPEALTSSWNALQQLDDVGVRQLEEFEEPLDAESLKELYPYNPAHLLMENEFVELFDTTADLSGADLDVSRFIRSGDERDLQVFWVDVSKSNEPDSKRKPLRDELCSIPFLAARDWLCEKKKSKLKSNKRAWIWDWLEGEWSDATREMLLPGRIVCVASTSGGYSTDAGFAPQLSAKVNDLFADEPQGQVGAAEENDFEQNGEPLSQSDWKTIAFHCQEVAEETGAISSAVGLSAEVMDLLDLAARWHDLGKAHPAFQGLLRDSGAGKRPERTDLAKGPKQAWVTDRRKLYTYSNGSDRRPGFRHELASALAMFAILRDFAPDHEALLGPWSELLSSLSHTIPEPVGPCDHPEIQRLLKCSADQFDLLVYLVASHHGKVRVALHAAPADQDYEPPEKDQHRGLPIRGVRAGDVIPATAITPDGDLLPEIALTLEPASLGLSFETGASWRERMQCLIARFGPATLGYLEAILRSADVRASRSTRPDAAFQNEGVAQ